MNECPYCGAPFFVLGADVEARLKLMCSPITTVDVQRTAKEALALIASLRAALHRLCRVAEALVDETYASEQWHPGHGVMETVRQPPTITSIAALQAELRTIGPIHEEKRP